ncbi:Hypothetical predicted protein [Pelobates cultripes]|uniref:Uncharacterized protein n=1 Tax=Pelobates cultripes TaxID=61616 RepID=A0AAD1W4H6_PELCU|nr:Hypothetical predicted protein [Pelobates cultripes]
MAAPGESEALAEPLPHKHGDPTLQPSPQTSALPAPGYPDVSTLATKQDIMDLLNDIKKLLAADVELVRATEEESVPQRKTSQT